MSDEHVVFESVADQQGYTQLPNAVLTDETLSVTARLLYGVLRYHAWQGDSCFPGQERIATNFRLTARSIRTYMRELEAAMLVRTERRGRGQTNVYILLALGLRAHRLGQDRKPTSAPKTGSQLPLQTGSLLPPKKTQGEEDADRKERARAPRLKVAGRPVNAEAWEMTQRVLTEFNVQTGRHLRALTSAGAPSEAAKRIYGRVRDYPDLTFEDHARIISVTLESRWWGDGRESVGVVYGPRIFEDNIARRPGERRDGAAAPRRTPDEQRRFKRRAPVEGQPS